ncbi:MAG: hypothetical protein S4CHLAM102_14540 [Chlamydiia bacterium]|nr:hypothetical protein [Chlamydiia bacterium]
MLATNQKDVLYLGIDPTNFKTDRFVRHLPLIRVVPRPLHAIDVQRAFRSLLQYTHIVFTSKSSVKIFFRYIKKMGLSKDQFENVDMIAIGRITAAYLREEGFEPIDVAKEESVEGLLSILGRLNLDDAYVLLTRASTVYPTLSHFLIEKGVRYEVCDLYTIVENIPRQLPSLRDVDEVVFSNPLTVENFFRFFQPLPIGLKLTALGPMTKRTLEGKLDEMIDSCQVHSESAIHISLSRETKESIYAF